MYCHKCLSKQNEENKKIGFRDTCSKCGFDLHVCKNCRHYAEDKPNDCNIFDIEPVSDKEKFNFCEEFSPNEKPVKSHSGSLKEASQKLGEKEELKKKDFKSLFED
jgi:hypothetical protein